MCEQEQPHVTTHFHSSINPERRKQRRERQREMFKTKLHNWTIIFLLALFFLHTHFFTTSTATDYFDLSTHNTSEIAKMVKRVCTQKSEECITEPEMVESATNRRLMAMQKKYISYETLRRDMVPCSKRGVSYYECHSGAANSYGRGCEVITRCARNVNDINS